MVTLSKGQNIVLSSRRIRTTLTWTPTTPEQDLDLSALVLSPAGVVRYDEDLVFYNAPRHPSGAVTHLGPQSAAMGKAEGVEIDLARLPDDVARVAVVVSINHGDFGDVADLAVLLTDAASQLAVAEFAALGATCETALVAGEFYRRGGDWKFRAVGQGWADGLAGVTMAFGVDVADDEPPVPPADRTSEHVDDRGDLRFAAGDRARLPLALAAAPRLDAEITWYPARAGRPLSFEASALLIDGAGAVIGVVGAPPEAGAWHGVEHRSAMSDLVGGRARFALRLAALPPEVTAVAFTLTSFGGQRFTEVGRVLLRLDDGSGSRSATVDLPGGARSTGAVVAVLVRAADSGWEIRAVGTHDDARTGAQSADAAARAARG